MAIRRGQTTQGHYTTNNQNVPVVNSRTEAAKASTLSNGTGRKESDAAS